MKRLKNKLILGIGAVVVLIGGYFGLNEGKDVLQGRGDNNPACVIETQQQVEVGPQNSNQLIATSSRRAWAAIRVTDFQTSTTTIWLSLNQDAEATIGTGIPVNASTTNIYEVGENVFTFGLNTELPYIGSVTGIKATGSTTMQVIECNYTK